MVRATSYELMIDWDRDGFFCKDVRSSSKLNLLPRAHEPSLAYYVAHPGYTTVEERFEHTPFGDKYWRLTCTDDTQYHTVNYGAANQTTPDGSIEVVPNTNYRFTCWLRVVSLTSGTPRAWVAVLPNTGAGGGNSNGTATLVPGFWYRYSVTFSSLTATSVLLIAGVHASHSMAGVLDIGGMMLTTPTTPAPTVFNAGDATNYLDDVSSYLESAEWRWGIEQYSEAVAAPSRAVLTLNNDDGEWSPENADSVYGSLLSRNVLVRLRAYINYVRDGTMEATGTEFWQSWNGATVAKTSSLQYQGTYSLRLTRAGSQYSGAMQTGVFVPGRNYRISGVALVLDLNQATPRVAANGGTDVLWTGLATSLEWQPFLIDYTAVTDELILQVDASSDGKRVQFDAIVVTDQDDNAPYYQQYIGSLEKVTADVGSDGHRRVQLYLVDPMRQLQEAEYAPLLLEDVTTDEALLAMFNTGVVHYPYGTSQWLLEVPGASELGDSTILYNQTITDFEVGDTTLEFAGDTGDLNVHNPANDFLREIVYAEGGGKCFWNPKTGSIVFFRRTRDIRSSAAADVVGVIELDDPPEYSWADDVVNDVTVNFFPRAVGTAASVMYTLGNVPYSIVAGDTRQFTVRYQAPDAPNAKVAGKDMITPVANTDYTINAQADGGGADKTGSCTVTVQFRALDAIITIVNGDASTVYVTFFRLRGTPLTSYAMASAHVFDAVSIGANGRIRRVISLPALGNEEFAQTYANYLLQRYKSAVGRIRAIAQWANRDADTLYRVLTKSVGDYLQIEDAHIANKGINYSITALHHILKAEGAHWSRMTLEPLDRLQYWILDDAALSVLDETTRLSVV